MDRIEQQAILWGAWRNDAHWYDNRVGWAKLDYPQTLASTRNVYAHYYEYLDRGRVAFVWIYDLGDKSFDPMIDEGK